MGWGQPHAQEWSGARHRELLDASEAMAAAVRRYLRHPSALHREEVGAALSVYATAKARDAHPRLISSP